VAVGSAHEDSLLPATVAEIMALDLNRSTGQARASRPAELIASLFLKETMAVADGATASLLPERCLRQRLRGSQLHARFFRGK